MKSTEVSQAGAAAAETAPGYPTRREFLENAGKWGLAALGLAGWAGVCRAAEEVRLAGKIRVPGEPPVLPPPKPSPPPSDVATPEMRAKVEALAKKLGDRDSQVRASTVKALIAIGTVCADEAGQKTWPNKVCVLTEMEKCRNDADPEIAGRACEVIAAIQKATSPALPPQAGEEGELRTGGAIPVLVPGKW